MLKKILLIITIFMIITIKLFAWSYNNNQSEIKVFLGVNEDYYFGSELAIALDENISIEWGIKNYMSEKITNLRFKPKFMEYMFGIKIGNLGWQTFCTHDFVDEYKKIYDENGKLTEELKLINFDTLKKGKPMHRFYIDIYQDLPEEN